jgi:hypothetical protein
MNVAGKYVDLVFSTPPNEVRWITQDEFDSDLRGFIPELQDWVGAKCDTHTSGETIISDVMKTRSTPLNNTRISEDEKEVSVSAKRSSEIVKCWMQAKTELPTEAWRRVFLGK